MPGPVRDARMFRRKVLFGWVLVNGVRYAADEFRTMLLLETVLVCIDPSDVGRATVALSCLGPFFRACAVVEGAAT